MKIQFTKASKNDGVVVTVSLSHLTRNGVVVHDFYNGSEVLPSDLDVDSGFNLVTSKGVVIPFLVNRSGRTAVTTNFPRGMRLPKVGQPVTVDVQDTARWY